MKHLPSNLPVSHDKQYRSNWPVLCAANVKQDLSESDGTCAPLHAMSHMAVCQNRVPLVNIKIAGKWMFIPLKMVVIGIDP